MFKHILFPTDGAATNSHIIRECVEFAKDAGADIVALHVLPTYSPAFAAEIAVVSMDQFHNDCAALAEEYLSQVTAIARAAGVSCTPLHVTSELPYDAIIRTAEEQKCDLIVMASHGRKGIKGMILGSETQKVLTHTKIPVLVLR